jgi:uncharacterized protein
MKIKFDAAKDKANRVKHGLSLAFAVEFDWGEMLIQVDDRHEYGEERWLGIARARTRIYTVIFTVRGDERMRIISLRRATNREIRRYETQARE